jgi:hypothetical protein
MSWTDWRSIDTVPECVTVLLYCAPSLYPVVGFMVEPAYFILEEGGPEDDEARTYPTLRYVPTHWAPLPTTPDEGHDD